MHTLSFEDSVGYTDPTAITLTVVEPDPVAVVNFTVRPGEGRPGDAFQTAIAILPA